MQDELPPEFKRIAHLADQQPPHVREVFQFMMSVAMEESGIAKLINTAHVDGWTWYSYESASGDVHSVVRPHMITELERKMKWRGARRGVSLRPQCTMPKTRPHCCRWTQICVRPRYT